ncbi:outer membrane beta-barrel protein [Oscillatoria amoena NRMC-F 0135]|nr:outer membrane beta-barrel protein [Oscillatoria laete-virens]MDL5047487.1 outer membrane beta-barrel protein [Oscillatoria amoena NRMC-F 0135]MDL5054688.1 outer membrane beta-barrel protein [Oscillatoria laete-virens NRMC-F 0139]
MTKFSIATLCAAAVMTSSLFAGSDKVAEMKKLLEDQGIQPNYVETAQKGVKLSGYVDVSYTYKPTKGASQNPNNVTPPFGSRGNFDNDSNDFSVNAVKLALEKELSDANEFTAGFRIDGMMGEDAGILNGAGGGSASNLFLEQAYVQFRAPVGNGLDFKVGKFVTLLGYEVIESPANLNFSRGLLFTFAIPLTHTGALASYKFNDVVDMQLGIVNGWNNDDTFYGRTAVGSPTGNPFDNTGDFAKAVTGRINVTAPGGNANIAQSFIFSPDGEQNAFGPNAAAFTSQNAWVYDIWGNWAPKFANDKLLLGFNFDIGQVDGRNYVNNAVPLTNQIKDEALWYGIALYAKYQFTPKFSLATRGEYFVDEGGWRNGINTYGNNALKASELWSWTITASFDLWENMLARLEYRYDTGNQPVLGYVNGTDQHSIALNFVYSF